MNHAPRCDDDIDPKIVLLRGNRLVDQLKLVNRSYDYGIVGDETSFYEQSDLEIRIACPFAQSSPRVIYRHTAAYDDIDRLHIINAHCRRDICCDALFR